MSGEPLPILLIEDDPGDAMMLRLTLERSPGDYVISRASQLRRGIELARANTHQIIVTDLGLPDSRGFEAVERLSHASPHAAIIVMSGEDNEQFHLDALAHGADSYLCKTDMTPETVHRSIQQSLHRVRQNEEIYRLIQASTGQRQRLKEQSLLLANKNRRLEQLCTTSQDFVNNVSHEFRTPLCVVKQYASLIAEGVVGPVNDEQRKMLGVIEGRVDDLNTMVDDMLDISRHESGLLAASRVECSVLDIVGRVLPGLQQRAKLREITLSYDVPDNLSSVYCDPEKISRVLTNLVVNALKFCRPNDTVDVKASQCSVNKEVTVAVCDSGPGIDTAQKDSIFARFKQGDTNLRSSTKGFGLGLSIARDLVTLNLGEMSLHSVVGQGSTFSFSIPVNNSVELGRRYLKRLHSAENDRLRDACVVRATVDDRLSTESKREVHQLLNYLLRSNDLLLPTEHDQWILILNTHRNELPRFFERVRCEIESLNRNRPQGPLPIVKLSTVGEIDDRNAEKSLQELLQVDPTKTQRASQTGVSNDQ